MEARRRFLSGFAAGALPFDSALAHVTFQGDDHDRPRRAASAHAPEPTAAPRPAPSDGTRAEALARNLSARLAACSLDELRVVDAMLARLELGRDRYGALDLSRPRAWDDELAEELLDVVVYKAIAKVLERDRASAGIASEAEIELRRARARAHDWPGPDDLDRRFDVGGEG